MDLSLYRGLILVSPPKGEGRGPWMMCLVEVGPEGWQGRNQREAGPEGQHVTTQSIKDQGSKTRIEDQGQGSRIKDRRSRIEDQGSRITDQRPRIKDGGGR